MKGNQRRGSHLCRCCLRRQVPCICPGPWGDTGTMSQPRSVLAGLRWGWERLVGRACPAAFALDPLSPLSHALLSLHLGTELFLPSWSSRTKGKTQPQLNPLLSLQKVLPEPGLVQLNPSRQQKVSAGDLLPMDFQNRVTFKKKKTNPTPLEKPSAP